MTIPVAKVKVGELITAEKMNEIIASINELEKRLDKLEGKATKRKIPEKKPLKVKNPGKILKVKTLKKKIPSAKNPKSKAPKRKSSKTKSLNYIDSVR